MGFLNKVKNIFFEEEIVEVEEEPIKVKKEEPVAKKIELPKAEKKEPELEYALDTEEFEIEKEQEEKENKFPMDFDEDDFKEERTELIEEENYENPAYSRRSERRKTITTYDDRIEEVFEEKEEQIVKREEPKYDFELEYGREKDRMNENSNHGLYEGKSAKKAFTPTPIISPIYGILDKNYKKDDVVTKKEIRLSSAPKKIDLDSVREKAYGDLTSDISQSMEEVKKKEYQEEINDLTDLSDTSDDDNLLYDLNDNTSPAVKKVTVGDAEEYFNELGLEYNVDYKDESIEQTKITKEKTRRSTSIEDEDDTNNSDEIVKENFDGESDDDGLESNLFDLIESMYDEKE
jgi:hypothetical protein